MAETLRPDRDWVFSWHNGLAPTPNLENSEALWIDPGLLIAQNAWLKSTDQQPLSLTAPPVDWLTDLDRTLSGRAVLIVRVEEIRAWHHIPSKLGNRPWSQVAGGRPPGFPAARRNLTQLQNDLIQAPGDSLIQISTHLDGIDQEWRVVIVNGRACASSGYCLHSGPQGHRITTVFDGAIFNQALRKPAEEVSVTAARQAGLDAVCMDLAFLSSPEGTIRPIILEANPAWCSSPYDYGHRGMRGFLEAVALGWTHPTGSGKSSQTGFRMEPYSPDPWMVRSFGRRYQSYWGRQQSEF